MENCPDCSADLRDKEIPAEYLRKGYYGPWAEGDPPRYWYRTIGVELPGVYDGILFWQCPDCGYRWHRWADKRMRSWAEPYLAKPEKREASR